MDPPAYHTLSASARVTAVNGDTSSQTTFTWGSFKGFAQYSDIYQFFRPLRYRIISVGLTNVTSSGLYPFAMP